MSASSTAPAGYVLKNASFMAPQSAFDASGSASCPAGTVTWGGGSYFSAWSPPTSINTSQWNSATPGGWQVRVNNPQAFTATWGVIAVCADKPARYTLAFTNVDDPAGVQAGGTATCPANTVIISGGVGSTADMVTVYMTSAHATTSRKFHADQQNGSGMDQPFNVYALCAAKPAGYVRRSASSSVAAKSLVGTAVAACPTGTSVISGGFGLGSPTPAVIAYDSFPQGDAWAASVDNTTTTAQQLTAYVICAA